MCPSGTSDPTKSIRQIEVTDELKVYIKVKNNNEKQ